MSGVRSSSWGDGLAVWLSYRPSDFLMFSPQVYDRLFDAWNAQAAPLAVLAGAAALALLGAGSRWGGANGPSRTAGAALPAAWAGLGLLWIVIAWGFHGRLWAPVFSAAPAYGVAFAVQGLGLLALATGMAASAASGPSGWRWVTAGPRARAAAGLAAAAVLLHPLSNVVAGRATSGLEWFGLAPEPTALGTLALWLALRPPLGTASRWAVRGLAVIPVAWGTLAGLTLHTMERPGAAAWVVTLTAGALVVAWRCPPDADTLRR